MEFPIFKKQVMRLQKTYGQDNYPDECITAMWNELKHVSGSRFVKAIDRVLANNVNPKWAPGIDKIEASLALVREEDHLFEKETQKEEIAMLYKRGTGENRRVPNAEASRRLGEILKGNYDVD